MKNQLNSHKNICMKGPLSELSCSILPGLKYLGTNFVNNKSIEEKKKEKVHAKYVDIQWCL